MTREEAITTLKEMHESFDEIHENTNYEIGYEQMTALDMAIEALSAEEAVWNEYEAEFTDLPDIPRYYYEKVVGKMAHEINMLKEQLESADAVQGEWIHDGQNFKGGLDWCHCSECGYKTSTNGLSVYRYCPNCGARMEANE